jgi:hypothetical protein
VQASAAAGGGGGPSGLFLSALRAVVPLAVTACLATCPPPIATAGECGGNANAVSRFDVVNRDTQAAVETLGLRVGLYFTSATPATRPGYAYAMTLNAPIAPAAKPTAAVFSDVKSQLEILRDDGKLAFGIYEDAVARGEAVARAAMRALRRRAPCR